MRRFSHLLVWLSLGLLATGAQAIENDPVDRLDAATDILAKTLSLPEQEIPPALLRDAQGIAVIPGVIKAGFVVGGSYGRSVDGLLHGKFTLGVDAAVAAGPIGRQGEAATDVELNAEIVSYSRSRGLFAGVSLEGAQLDIDHETDVNFYGKEVNARDIQAGKVTMHASAGHFMQAVRKAAGP